MMHTTLKENTMNIECKEYQIYIGCDDKRLYDDLHEAVDNVLKKHYAPTEEYGEDKWVVLIEFGDAGLIDGDVEWLL